MWSKLTVLCADLFTVTDNFLRLWFKHGAPQSPKWILGLKKITMLMSVDIFCRISDFTMTFSQAKKAIILLRAHEEVASAGFVLCVL